MSSGGPKTGGTDVAQADHAARPRALDPACPDDLRAAARVVASLGPRWQADAATMFDIASDLEEEQAKAAARDQLIEKAARVLAEQFGSSADVWEAYTTEARALYDAGLLAEAVDQ